MPETPNDPQRALVEVRHPRVERTARVPASAVPWHRRAGWVPVDEAERARRRPAKTTKDEEAK